MNVGSSICHNTPSLYVIAGGHFSFSYDLKRVPILLQIFTYDSYSMENLFRSNSMFGKWAVALYLNRQVKNFVAIISSAFKQPPQFMVWPRAIRVPSSLPSCPSHSGAHLGLFSGFLCVLGASFIMTNWISYVDK